MSSGGREQPGPCPVSAQGGCSCLVDCWITRRQTSSWPQDSVPHQTQIFGMPSPGAASRAQMPPAARDPCREAGTQGKCRGHQVAFPDGLLKVEKHSHICLGVSFEPRPAELGALLGVLRGPRTPRERHPGCPSPRPPDPLSRPDCPRSLPRPRPTLFRKELIRFLKIHQPVHYSVV